MAGPTDEDFKFPDEAQQAAKDSTGIETDIDTNDIQVDIVDDTPEADRGRPALDEPITEPTDDELATYSTKVQDRIKKLTHARHDERRRADTLQRERDELETVAKKAIADRDSMRGQYVKGAEILSSQTKAISEKAVLEAKAKLKAAHDAFDTDAIVEAQTELNEAQMNRSRFENIRVAPIQQTESVVESQQQTKPVAPKLDTRTSEWMAKNTWFGENGDEAMTGYALGLHNKLVKKYGEGFTRTDEYYSQIDADMRQTFPSTFKAKQTQGRQNDVVAPATRVLAPRRVTLTSTQVALAKKFGMTPQQYAAELVKLEK
jgi:hypothetical protein